MPRTRIKICGIRDVDTALAAADAGADAIGLVFVRSSPRFIDPDEARDVMLSLPPFVSSVGVFMNTSPEAFADTEEACPTSHTQFHGSEDEALVNQCGPVLKAIRYTPDSIATDLARWEACDDVEAILIDGPAPGEGVPFLWESLVPLLAHLHKPVILAGGLTPENVGDAIRTVKPFGVDVSSGVESSRGVKDEQLIEAFCDAVRRADQD
jgi:phosphoribosylanthranilate isomerase